MAHRIRQEAMRSTDLKPRLAAVAGISRNRRNLYWPQGGVPKTPRGGYAHKNPRAVARSTAKAAGARSFVIDKANRRCANIISRLSKANITAAKPSLYDRRIDATPIAASSVKDFLGSRPLSTDKVEGICTGSTFTPTPSKAISLSSNAACSGVYQHCAEHYLRRIWQSSILGTPTAKHAVFPTQSGLQLQFAEQLAAG